MNAERDSVGGSTKSAWRWSIVALIVCVLTMTIARVEKTLRDPNFDPADASGLLKSDPGLLYYLVERVVESKGLPPADWRADPRIEHPALFDVPRHLPVAQEFVVAWLRMICGEALPLHVFCSWVAGAFASLALVGVWILAAELTRRAGQASLAVVFALLLPASWRTMGFVLMDEDFAWPFFILHVGLLLRAVRVRTPTAVLFASLALVAALATWHASGFLFTIEMIAILCTCLVRSVNPLRERFTWIAPPVLLAAAFVIPFQRHGGLVTSIGVLIALALWIEGLSRERVLSGMSLRVRVLICLILFGALGVLAASHGSGAHDHVFALLRAKVEFFGERPADPLALSPDVRLMWQGPFATLAPATAWSQLGTALVVAALAIFVTLRNRVEAPLFAVSIGVTLALAAAWSVERVVVLSALLAPAAALALLMCALRRGWAIMTLFVLVLAQAGLFVPWFVGFVNPWYASPVQRQAEIRELVGAIPSLVPEDEAIAADSINSTAILVHTRRRAILSPKWEARASRERVVEFITAFHSASPADFRELLLSKYRCRYLLVDRVTLGYLCAYTAGLRDFDPRPGSAASVFLSQDADILTSVSGYRLLYRSPEKFVQSNGAPTDFFRLYALDGPRSNK